MHDTRLDEEFPVGAGQQPASITSLPFVHTARRYYRSNGPVRSSDLADDAAGQRARGAAAAVSAAVSRACRVCLGVRCLEKTTEPDRLEEVKSRNKVSVGEPAEGSLSMTPRMSSCPFVFETPSSSLSPRRIFGRRLVETAAVTTGRSRVARYSSAKQGWGESLRSFRGSSQKEMAAPPSHGRPRLLASAAADAAPPPYSSDKKYPLLSARDGRPSPAVLRPAVPFHVPPPPPPPPPPLLPPLRPCAGRSSSDRCARDSRSAAATAGHDRETDAADQPPSPADVDVVTLLWTATVSVARVSTRPPCFSRTHFFLNLSRKKLNQNKTLDGGSLGSSVDEERGQPRELMRIAGLSEHRHLERTLRPRDPLSRGPVRSRGGKWHVFSLDSREASHRPPRRSFFMKELPVSYAEETGTSQEEPAASIFSSFVSRLKTAGRFLTTASSPRLQNVDYGHAQTATVVAPSFRSRRSKYKPWASRSQSVPPPPPYSAVTVRGRVLLSYLKHRRPRLGRDDPLNLSISLSGGKETNRDSLSNGDKRLRDVWRMGRRQPLVFVSRSSEFPRSGPPAAGARPIRCGRRATAFDPRVGLLGNAAQSGW
ncbi:unnamed protein product [Acanthosepion pharaonis]|uniref:Uncharacterized protein n=1 Tax=Acanthosepion pharaonis TaxID=158019 RepID=A0A812EMX7_ACAPH|nr:unnamed protein product [Sepia pharaonis]